MAQPSNHLIAESVNRIIKQCYPDNYYSLCHAHAIVGANVISVVLQRNFRPVAGLAVIDCGGGSFIHMTDNNAFSNDIGGAFHCWIESADRHSDERELVDLTFRHNRIYAAKNRIPWKKKNTPDFLWGLKSQIALKAEPHALPRNFASKPILLCETPEGATWLTNHLADNLAAYVKLTSETLRLLKRRVPSLQLAA